MSKYVVDDYEASASKTAEREYATKVNFWRPDPGTHFVRVLPPLESMIDPAKGKAPFYWLVPVHFGIAPGNKRTVYCPRRASRGELPCAICEVWLPYVRRDSTATAQERAVAIDFLPKWQNYMNVILLNPKTGEPIREEDGSIKVRVWGAGNDIIDKILRRIEEIHEETDEWISLTHPTKGRVLRLVREGKGKEDTDYDVTIKKAMSIEPLEEWWGENLVDLPLINPPTTPEFVAKLVAGKSGGDAFEQPALPEPSQDKALAEGGNPFDDDVIEAEYKDVTDDAPAPAPKAAKAKSGSSKKLAALLEGED